MPKDWDVRLAFDGNRLCFVKESTNECIKCWKGRSGILDSEGNTQPINVEKSNNGPIPPGEYIVNVDTIQWRLDKKGREKPEWEGRSLTAWGDARVKIIPKKGTETFGRSKFYLHGGRVFGSIGCVDLSLLGDEFFEFWEDNFDQKGKKDKNIEFLVDYSGNSMPDDCEEPLDFW